MGESEGGPVGVVGLDLEPDPLGAVGLAVVDDPRPGADPALDVTLRSRHEDGEVEGLVARA